MEAKQREIRNRSVLMKVKIFDKDGREIREGDRVINLDTKKVFKIEREHYEILSHHKEIFGQREEYRYKYNHLRRI